MLSNEELSQHKQYINDMKEHIRKFKNKFGSDNAVDVPALE